MSITDIQIWLRNPHDHAQGVTLLEALGKPTPALLRLVKGPATGYTRQRLQEALQKVLSDAQSAPNAHVPAPRKEDPATQMRRMVKAEAVVDDWPLHRYPVELQELKQQSIAWMREFDTLHGVLRTVPTKVERYQTALRLKELDDLIHAAFHRLDAYRATGTDIGGVVEPAPTMVELVNRRNTLRSQISRATRGTRPTTPEKLEHWKQQLALVNAAIDAAHQG